MSRSKMKMISWLQVMTMFAVVAAHLSAGRQWSVRDDVEFSEFRAVNMTSGGTQRILLSPNGKFALFCTKKGNFDLDAPEDTLWCVSTADVENFMVSTESTRFAPSLTKLVQMTSEKDGGDATQAVIESVRWKDDSISVFFTALAQRDDKRFRRLFRVDLSTREISALTPENEDVLEFAATGDNYVYRVGPPDLVNQRPLKPERAGRSAGASLVELSPHELFEPKRKLAPFPQEGLWAVINGRRFEVRERHSGKPFLLNHGGRPKSMGLALSPDGRHVVAILMAKNAPEKWRRYKPPPGKPYELMPYLPYAYHLIEIETGDSKLLVDAPQGSNRNWNSRCHTARWSSDGSMLLLSNVFLPFDSMVDASEEARESNPYIAVLDLKSGQLRQLLAVKAGLDKARYGVADLRFSGSDKVVINFEENQHPGLPESAVFQRQNNNAWQMLTDGEDPRQASLAFQLRVVEDLNKPPLLVAERRDESSSKTLFDPNPQLKEIEIGSAKILRWTDESGFEYTAGIVKPVPYIAGKRYPLVIQTHGIEPKKFLYDGVYHCGFAARAMAAQGICVAQMNWHTPSFVSPDEGPAQVRGFASLIRTLDQAGVIDPHRVGAIGYSRSVYHVLEAITYSPTLLAAASVTDGIMFSYYQTVLMTYPQRLSEDVFFNTEFTQVYGGHPWSAEALPNWVHRAPGFNMEKVSAPLLLLQPGISSAIHSWEPFAALTALKKPVEFIMIPSGTHPMSNPQQRWLAGTANVDWFRFWLNHEERIEPEPDAGETRESLAEQYIRWRKLRELRQSGGNVNTTIFGKTSGH